MTGCCVLHLHNAAPGSEQRLADFFQAVHAPELARLRGFSGVQRFCTTETQLMVGIAQPWAFATLYDFDLPSPEIDIPALAGPVASMRDAGLIAQDGTERLYAYEMFSPWKYSQNLQAGKPLTHLMFLLANVTPGREVEYHAWYDEVHSVEVTQTPGYVGMRRGRLSDVQPPPIAYCPGSQLILGGLQTNDLDYTVREFTDRALGTSVSGVAWAPRSTAASVARTVHLCESLQGPYPAAHLPGA